MDSYNRRDFLLLTSSVAGLTALATVTWPFVAQLLPPENSAQNAQIDVDLSHITEGMAITVKWQNKPVLIMHRTQKQIAAARATPLNSLKDKYARNANLPSDSFALDEARTAKGHENWLIVVNICTHLGCIPSANAGAYGGFYCACHASVYDSAGRIRQGPASKNLYIPPYQFLNDHLLRIG